MKPSKRYEFVESIVEPVFFEEQVVRELSGRWVESWPHNHVVFDNFLDAEFLDSLINRNWTVKPLNRFYRSLEDPRMTAVVERISGLWDVRFDKPGVQEIPSPDPSDFVGSSEGRDRRVGMVVMLARAEGKDGAFEIWRSEPPALLYRIPFERGRMILFDVRGDLFYGFTPPLGMCSRRGVWAFIDFFYGPKNPAATKPGFTRLPRRKMLSEATAVRS